VGGFGLGVEREGEEEEVVAVVVVGWVGEALAGSLAGGGVLPGESGKGGCEGDAGAIEEA